MAVLKILILFLLIGKGAKLVRCQTSEEYDYYADESSERTEPNPTKMAPNNELTHVRTKNLSGNVKLTTLQVLTTNTPLDELNNVFENEEDILDEATKVMGTWRENKQDEVQTIPENQQNVALLSELGTAPTDGMESFGLMDVFNSTSGTLPDQDGTEKLITVTPLNFELIHEESNSATSINLPKTFVINDAGLDDEFEKVFGANSAQTADSENFNVKGTTAEVTFIDGISTLMTTANPERSTVLNEKSATFTTDFTTTQRYMQEFSENKFEEMETSSTFQQPVTVTTNLYKYQPERVTSLNGDVFTTSSNHPSMSTQIVEENNTHERIANSQNEITTTEEIRTKLNSFNLIVNTARNLDQSREDIENLSSFIDVDEEFLKNVTGVSGEEVDENLNLEESIEDVSMIFNSYDEESNTVKSTTTIPAKTIFQFTTTGKDVLTSEQNGESYSTTLVSDQKPVSEENYNFGPIFITTEDTNKIESQNSASTLNFEETTKHDSNYVKQETITVQTEDLQQYTFPFTQQTTLGMTEYTLTPFTTEEFTLSTNSAINEETTTNNYKDLLHINEFTTVGNILNTQTQEHNFFDEMVTDTIFANSETTLTMATTSKLPNFSVITEEEKMDNGYETTTGIFTMLPSETTTNNDVFPETSSGKNEDISTTFLVTGSTEHYPMKDFQETHDTTSTHTTIQSQDNSKYFNDVTGFVITSSYLLIEDKTTNTAPSSPSYEPFSTINVWKINDTGSKQTRNGKELLTTTDENSTKKNEFSTVQTEVQTELSTVNGVESTPGTFSTTTTLDGGVTTFTDSAKHLVDGNEEFITKTDLTISDSVTPDHGIVTYVSESNASEFPLEFETGMFTEKNVDAFSTVNTVTDGENNLVNDITVLSVTMETMHTAKEYEEIPSRTTVSRISAENNEQDSLTTTHIKTYESTSTYEVESTTTTVSNEENLEEGLLKLLTTGITNFFETLMDGTVDQIETSLSLNNDEAAEDTDNTVDKIKTVSAVPKSEVGDDGTSNMSTTIMYSTFKENTEDINFDENSENFDKIVEQSTSSVKLKETNVETVTKEYFITVFKNSGDERNTQKEGSEPETSTTFVNEAFANTAEDYFKVTTTAITQSIKMSTIVDSLINSVDGKQEFNLTRNTTSEKMKMQETEPQVTTNMDGRTLYFSIKITDNGTSFFVPSDAFLTILSPNTVNITWKSATTNMNNSLQLTLGNSVQLNVVKGTQMHIHKSVLIPELENKLDVDTNLITMDDGIQIYFSNTEFLKKDQENQNAFTADALPSVPTQTELLAAEIVGGCIGVFVIAAILIYWVIKKFKTKTHNFKPNGSV